MTASKPLDLLRSLAKLAAHDPGLRGFSTAAADASQLPEAADSLLQAERVVITTGFCIRAAMIGENDGPPGAMALADALCRLGKEVVFVSDRFSVDLLKAGAQAYGYEFSVIVLDSVQAVADEQIAELLRGFRPTHVVAIERPGSALDGHRYSMRGEILDDLVPATDALLAPPGARDYLSIAIGDGGNELGMGSLRATHMHHVAHGEKIFCATPADFVIAAGISNWGGHALVAALSVLSGRALMPTASQEYRVLECLQAAGAVDGCTGRPALSVDGIAWDTYADTLQQMRETVLSSGLLRPSGNS